MKVSLHPVVVVCSAALAACCLAAGRGRLPVSPARHPPVAAVLQGAGQALTQLRRRTRLAARRAMQALLACLTLPLAAWMAAAGAAQGFVLALPDRVTPARALLPACGDDPDAAPGFAAPPGNAAPPARASPPPDGGVFAPPVSAVLPPTFAFLPLFAPRPGPRPAAIAVLICPRQPVIIFHR